MSGDWMTCVRRQDCWVEARRVGRGALVRIVIPRRDDESLASYHQIQIHDLILLNSPAAIRDAVHSAVRELLDRYAPTAQRYSELKLVEEVE